mgnify:CR=1 FL=1
MRREEIDLTTVFIKHIKRVGGRGPRNIHCKLEVEKKSLSFVFWLGKSAFEQFIFDYTKNGKMHLRTLYEDVFSVVCIDLLAELSNVTNLTLTLKAFTFDLNDDRFEVDFIIEESGGANGSQSD